MSDERRPPSREATLVRLLEEIRSELDLRVLLTRILSAACTLLDTRDGSIGLLDEERGVIRIEAIHRMPDSELGTEWPPGRGLAGRVLAKGDLVIAPRYDQLEPDCEPELAANSVIGAPIRWRNRLIGFFGIGSPPGRVFDEEDQRSLRLLASHAAIAIENARLVAHLHGSIQQLGLVVDTARRIGAATTVDEVVEAYLTQVANAGRFHCTIIVSEFNDRGRRVANRVRGSWGPGREVQLLDRRVPAVPDELDPALDSGETVAFADVRIAPEAPESLRQEQVRDNRPAVALVPLMSGGHRVGLAVISHDRPHHWTEEELDPYRATAPHLASALEVRSEHEARVESERRYGSLEERRLLARELHDSVTQTLFSMSLLAEALTDQDLPQHTAASLARISEMSQHALGEMRQILKELRPVEEANLKEQIEQVRERILGLPHVEVCVPAALPITPEQSRQLASIVREALNNIAKHAMAAWVEVNVLSTDAETRLVIEDDGVGFDHQAQSLGMGLQNINERAAEMGATVEITSEQGKGTRIEVCLPNRSGA